MRIHVQLRRSTEIGTINHKKDILKPIACNWLHLYNQEHKKKITHNTKPFYIPVQHLMSNFACILLEYTQHIYTYTYIKSPISCVYPYTRIYLLQIYRVLRTFSARARVCTTIYILHPRAHSHIFFGS